MAVKGPRESIPIYIGASGPKLSQLAGELADGWLPTHTDIYQLDVLKSQLDAKMQKNVSPSDSYQIGVTCGVPLALRVVRLATSGLRRNSANSWGVIDGMGLPS